MRVLVAQEANVSMIFTDYSMLEMTGYEVLKKVKVIQNFFPLSSFIVSHVCTKNLY